MPVRIIIDGYNLIRQSSSLSALEAYSLEEGRNGLVRLLAAYRKVKRHDVTVVFDGWRSDNIGRHRERIAGIDVVYSGRGEKADEVIMEMAGRMGEGVVVVTSDREIASYVQRRGAAVVPSHQFEVKLKEVCAAAGEAEGAYPDMQDDDDDVEANRGTKKKGPSRRLSKKDRRKRKALEKL